MVLTIKNERNQIKATEKQKQINTDINSENQLQFRQLKEKSLGNGYFFISAQNGVDFEGPYRREAGQDLPLVDIFCTFEATVCDNLLQSFWESPPGVDWQPR